MSGYARLDDQIAWLDRKSSEQQRRYRRLKVVSIGAAALVPLVTSIDGYAFVAGALGVVVVIVEGLLHVNQHHEHWLRYRSSCESLRHEKYLYLARAGRYEGQSDGQALRQLAVHVELLLAREGEQWAATLRNVENPRPAPINRGLSDPPRGAPR